jgi:hypothetical protein
LRATPRLVAAVVITIGVVVVGVTFGGYYGLFRSSPQKTAPRCGDPYATESHIYNPDRLVVYKDCQIVSGIVYRVIVEADGNYHIQLALEHCLPEPNEQREQQHPVRRPVLEIVCANPVTQQDAIYACQSYVNHVTVPQEGQHITTIGRYVLDIDHGWTEIHPVYSLTITG